MKDNASVRKLSADTQLDVVWLSMLDSGSFAYKMCDIKKTTTTKKKLDLPPLRLLGSVVFISSEA